MKKTYCFKIEKATNLLFLGDERNFLKWELGFKKLSEKYHFLNCSVVITIRYVLQTEMTSSYGNRPPYTNCFLNAIIHSGNFFSTVLSHDVHCMEYNH